MRTDANGNHYFTPSDVQPTLQERVRHPHVDKSPLSHLIFGVGIVLLLITFFSM